jgi:hypothetical protein
MTPRTVRNFWIEADIDGQKTRLVGGPRQKDGGFQLEIKMRGGKEISPTSIVVTGTVTGDGYLSLQVSTKDETHTTPRLTINKPA